jgi:hypothetical protein
MLKRLRIYGPRCRTCGSPERLCASRLAKRQIEAKDHGWGPAFAAKISMNARSLDRRFHRKNFRSESRRSLWWCQPSSRPLFFTTA